MTSPEAGVTVRLVDVHVHYRVYEDPVGGLKQHFLQGRLRRQFQIIEAVQGVTLDLHESETLGLIGPNGSGKSTLLSAMTGLLPLQSGTIRGRSRPSLLGVSSALRSALSGRRNILIGGLALGFTRAEVESRMDEIIDFAGLQHAIDRPMRTYSSGMRARLNFAIATARIPEILLIDEALAVGRRRLFGPVARKRIDEVRVCGGLGGAGLPQHGRRSSVPAIGPRGSTTALLRVVGDPDEVVSAYLASYSSSRPPSSG